MKIRTEPLVSIVMCFYNEEKFLTEAVESVLAQDYNNWELLIVDDGSSDASSDIARKYQQRYPGRIFYLEHDHHVNRGLSASRNLGISQADGELIAFIDADDVWHPSKLSRQVGILQKHPGVTVVLEASNYWYSWIDSVKTDIVIPVGVKQGVYRPPQLSLALYPLGKGAAPCPSGIIAHRAVFKRCPFEESFTGIYQMYEDQAFLGKVYLKETVFVSEICNNNYRQRPESLVSSVHETGKYHHVRSFYLQWFRDYLNQQQGDFANVRRLLARAELRYRNPRWHKIAVELPMRLKDVAARLLVRAGILTYRKTW